MEVLRGVFVPGDGGLAVVRVNLDDRLVDEHPQSKGLAGSGRNLGLILNVLCVDGFIPKGKYVIDTSAPPNPIAGYTELLNEHHDPNHPECMAFRLIHPDPEFQRRARVLDKLTREYKQKLEEPNE